MDEMASQQLFTSIRRAGFGLAPRSSQVPAALAQAMRLYASAAGLDRGAVEERILHVLSSFSKVDPKKVRQRGGAVATDRRRTLGSKARRHSRRRDRTLPFHAHVHTPMFAGPPS